MSWHCSTGLSEGMTSPLVTVGAEAPALLCHSTADGFCASDVGFGESSGPSALAEPQWGQGQAAAPPP